MTVTGIITAVVVGLAVGALGRLIAARHRTIPLWVAASIGVVAAMLGTIAGGLAGIDLGSVNLLLVVLQVGPATLAVVVATGLGAHRRPGMR